MAHINSPADPNTSRQDAADEQGMNLAAEHFKRLGYHVIARRAHTRFGDIDLVATDSTTLVFCDVNTRQPGSEVPCDAVSPATQAQVRRRAAAWLAEASAGQRFRDIRFDAVGIAVDADGRLTWLEHLESAF